MFDFDDLSDKLADGTDEARSATPGLIASDSADTPPAEPAVEAKEELGTHDLVDDATRGSSDIHSGVAEAVSVGMFLGHEVSAIGEDEPPRTLEQSMSAEPQDEPPSGQLDSEANETLMPPSSDVVDNDEAASMPKSRSRSQEPPASQVASVATAAWLDSPVDAPAAEMSASEEQNVAMSEAEQKQRLRAADEAMYGALAEEAKRAAEEAVEARNAADEATRAVEAAAIKLAEIEGVVTSPPVPSAHVWLDGFVGAEASSKGNVFSVDDLHQAVAEGATCRAKEQRPEVQFRNIGAPHDSLQIGFRSSPRGISSNALFVCHVDTSGTAVQVIAQSSMAVVDSVTCDGARVIDFALQAEDSHLLAAFDNGCVLVSRLTAERATPRILLEFEAPSVCAVLWHPTNPRVFFTLQPQRGILWHLALIVQYFTLQPAGFCAAFNRDLAQTSLRVNQELIKSAGSDVPLDFKHTDDIFCCAAFSLDGQYVVASAQNSFLLWRLAMKDEQTAPSASCVQRHPLPEEAEVPGHLRLVPRFAPDNSIVYVLVAVAGREVLLFTLDPRPGGGTGYWLPCGRLLQPVQQRLKFPCKVAADVFQAWDSHHWSHAVLLVTLVSEESAAEAELQLMLSGILADGELPDAPVEGKPIVPVLEAFRLPYPLTAIRAHERSGRVGSILPDGVEAPVWAVIGLRSATHPGEAAVTCFALPKLKPSPPEAFEKPPGLAEPSDRDVAAASLQSMCSDPIPIVHNHHASSAASAATGALKSPPSTDTQNASGEVAAPLQCDSDVVTPEMLRKLSDFMEKRAKMASDIVFEIFKERLPTVLSTAGYGSTMPSHSGPGRRKGKQEERDRDQGVAGMLKGISRDSNFIIEQISRGEKSASAALKQMSDPEQKAAGQKPLRAAIEKEVTRWRDNTLSKAVLKAVEGKAFSEKFSEGLLSASNDTAPLGVLLSALKPTKEQLQEALQADFRQWCTGMVSKHLKGGVLEERDRKAARSSFDLALIEIASQSAELFTRFLQDISARSKISQLSELCAKEVSEAIRQEVDAYRRSPLPQKVLPTGSRFAPPSRAMFRESFARRMRSAVAPLNRDLDSAAKDIASAGACIGRCRESADACEAASASDSSSFSRARSSVLSNMSSGRLRAALIDAMAWDADHLREEASLVELVCDQLQEPIGDDLAEATPPEEVLARSEVVSQLDGQLLSRLVQALLQRSVSEMSPSIGRIEANLEWVLGVLQIASNDEPGFVACMEAAREQTTSALESLAQGKSPAKLAQATQADKRRIAKSVRLAQKELSLLLLRR